MTKHKQTYSHIGICVYVRTNKEKRAWMVNIIKASSQQLFSVVCHTSFTAKLTPKACKPINHLLEKQVLN